MACLGFTYAGALTLCLALNNWDFLDIDTVFFAWFGYYFVLIDFWIYIYPDELPQVVGYTVRLRAAQNHELWAIATMNTIAITGFMCARVAGFGRVAAGYLPTFGADWQAARTLKVVSGLLLIGLSLLGAKYVGVIRYGESQSYGDSYAASEGLGLFAVGLNIAEIAVLALLLYDRRPDNSMAAHDAQRSPQARRSVVIVLFIVIAMHFVATGRRRCIVEFAMGIISVVHLYVVKISAKTLAAVIAASLVLCVIVGAGRHAMADGLSAVLWNGVSHFSASSFEVMKQSLGEPMAMFFVQKTILELTVNGQLVRGGETYLEGIELLVPEILKRDRPLGAARWFAAEIDPLYAAAGGGFAFNHVAEGFLNFGYCGVFVSHCVLGLIVATFIEYRANAPANQSRGLIHAALITGCIMFVRCDFGGVLKIWFVATVLPAIIVAGFLGREKAKYMVRH